MEKIMQDHPWYVIQTRSRFEKKCSHLLTKSGFTVYLPLQKRMKIWSDRLKEVDEPLFPGYLFVQFKEADRYPILNTQGIVRFVCFSGKYAEISSKQIECIKNAISSHSDMEIIDIGFEAGQQVLITSGPFKDNYAHVVRLGNGRGKLLLTLEAIGKGILLEIGCTHVEVLPQLQRA